MDMYNSISSIYRELFPLNPICLDFLKGYMDDNKPVLDIGCGDGKYVDALSDNHNVTGIDTDSGMIEEARKHCRGNFYPYSFDEIQILEDQYGCAYCIGNAISYLPIEKTGHFLQALYTMLLPEAYLIFQTVNWDKYRLEGEMDFPVKTAHNDICFYRHYKNGPDSTVIFSTELTQAGQRIDSWEHTLYPKYSLDFAELLRENSFEVQHVFGDYAHSAYDPSHSPACIIVAQKQ